MNTPGIKVHHPATNARMLHAPVLPKVPEKLRRVLNAAYAARGGAESMTLNDWRDLELQLNRRLEHEYKIRQR